MLTSARVEKRTITIANGASVSDPVYIEFARLIGFALPASMAGTAISFQGAAESTGPFTDIYKSDNSALDSVAIGSSRAYQVPNSAMPWSWIRFKTDQNQSADKQITVSLKS